MRELLSVVIFCVVLFLYLHITHHLNVSNDLEVYTIERPSKDKLEEICGLKQPVIFDYNNDDIMHNLSFGMLEHKYGAFDIKIRNINNEDINTEMHLPFILKEARNVFEGDNSSKYITENNIDFLEETGTRKTYAYNDSFLRPPMISKCEYDFLSGSNGSYTPLRYKLNHRNYFYVTSGSIDIKLIPPQNKRYLYVEKDYDNYEFRSPVNPWKVQEKYERDFNKVKSLDVTIGAGTIIVIPPYWFYSIKFMGMPSVCSMSYQTIMNTLAILPEIGMTVLQGQNIKHNIVNKLSDNGYVTKKEVKPVNPEVVLRPTVDKKNLKKIAEQEVKKEIALQNI
tara:strand:+ start:6056 stop:7069 length:1014 start_codon:yes stop_codon:yes gene_type:complete